MENKDLNTLAAFLVVAEERSFTRAAKRADSEGCRSAFRTDVDHDSEVMPISVPN
jgi:hypothetical protein